MDCRRFEQIRLEMLLGDATCRAERQAALHARDCEPCRRSASRDRRLQVALDLGAQAPEESFSRAQRKLMQALSERRAFCGRLDGPFGPVFLARTAHGLCRVSFRNTEGRFLEELEKLELMPDFAPTKVAGEVGQLEEYFSGCCRKFRLKVDLRFVTPFQRQVLRAAARIPFGRLASYADIARRIGKPGAQRAVGGALGKNPVAIVIPCHRVVASDGTIGGYTGGLDIKRVLMRIEGISLGEERA